MIRDGQHINYKDWRNETNILENVSMGTDNYFLHFVQSQQDAQPIPEGTPVQGYRFVYHPPGQDVLVSPFSHAKVHLLEELGDSAEGHRIGAVQHDTTERGFYYYRDRQVLEDYMRAFTGHVSDFERTPLKESVSITVSEGKGDSNYGAIPAPLSDSELFRKNISKDDKSIPVLPKTPTGGSNSVNSRTFTATAEEGDRIKARGYVRYPSMQFDPEKGWVDSYDVYKVANDAIKPNKSAFGTLEVYRVTGIAKANTYGDAGDIMQDMMYDPEPIISLDVAEIYKAMHP